LLNKNKDKMETRMTLFQIAQILKINSFRSKKIEGLDYFYYNQKESDTPCIVAYYKKQERRYSYTTAESFLDDHGIESVDELEKL